MRSHRNGRKMVTKRVKSHRVVLVKMSVTFAEEQLGEEFTSITRISFNDKTIAFITIATNLAFLLAVVYP